MRRPTSRWWLLSIGLGLAMIAVILGACSVAGPLLVPSTSTGTEEADSPAGTPSTRQIEAGETLSSPASTDTTLSPTLLPPETPPAGAESQFRTDFTRHTVPYDEIFSGGPPKDGIPAIDNPQFVTVEEALKLRDRAVRLPARRDDAFKKAAREEDRGAQGSLDL